MSSPESNLNTWWQKVTPKSLPENLARSRPPEEDSDGHTGGAASPAPAVCKLRAGGRTVRCRSRGQQALPRLRPQGGEGRGEQPGSAGCPHTHPTCQSGSTPRIPCLWVSAEPPHPQQSRTKVLSRRKIFSLAGTHSTSRGFSFRLLQSSRRAGA